MPAPRTAGAAFFLLPLAIANRHSRFGNSDMGREHAILSMFFWSGGIAQLVERQLCKLEVRGSNPLASKACKAWRQHLQTGNTFGSLLRALSQIGFWACVRQKTSLSSVPPHHSDRYRIPLPPFDFRFAICDCRFK